MNGPQRLSKTPQKSCRREDSPGLVALTRRRAIQATDGLLYASVFPEIQHCSGSCRIFRRLVCVGRDGALVVSESIGHRPKENPERPNRLGYGRPAMPPSLVLLLGLAQSPKHLSHRHSVSSPKLVLSPRFLSTLEPKLRP